MSSIKKFLSSRQGSYWNEKGDYQKEYNQLISQVPKSGKAKTLGLELLRCLSNLYYDCYNNGWANEKLVELEVLEKNESKISSFYKGRLPLKKLLGNLRVIQETLKGEETSYNSYDEEEQDWYFDYKSLSDFSKSSVEPYLDDLADAIVLFNLK